MSRKLLLTAALAALVAGCTTRTPYQAPALHYQAAYPQASIRTATTPGQGEWWKRFGDAELDRLVDQVLARSNGLIQAAIAVQHARAEIGLSVINPTVAGSLSGTGSQTLRGPSLTTRTYTTDLTASYEVDLFQQLAATRDAARFEARATEQDYESTRLTLIATTATAYYQLAFLNERIALERQSVDYAQKTLDLVTALRGAGAASGLDTAQALQSLRSQESTLEDLIRQHVAARNAIEVLLDGEPWRGAEPPRTPTDLPPSVAVGLPAELLGRRPDLRAAELRLREQLADRDATRASFYPSLTLTGGLGTTSTSLANLLRNPVGTLGANIALPFLQVDQMRLQNRVARLAYENALVGFRQTLYQALVDVDNALADRAHYAEEVRLSALSLQEARRVEQLDEVSYRVGSTTLKVWLDAQETRRQAEVTYAQNVLNAKLAQITLFKVLGGDA